MSRPPIHPDDERFYIENIEPLIVDVTQQGRFLHFLFRCPVSEHEVRARIDPSDPATAQELTARTQSTSRLHGIVRSALKVRPDGSPGRAETSSPTYRLDEIEEAACDAFESVSGDFVWDGSRWAHWEAEDRVLEFLEYADHLESIAPEHRALLERVLRCVAKADGIVYPAEHQLLAAMLGDDPATAGPLTLPTPEELRTLESKTLASAVVCLGYAIACVDGALSDTEERLLSVICEALGLSSLKQWELKKAAQAFCFDETLTKLYDREETPSGEERLEAYRFGRGLGLTVPELKELEWRFLKRSGLR